MKKFNEKKFLNAKNMLLELKKAYWNTNDSDEKKSTMAFFKMVRAQDKYEVEKNNLLEEIERLKGLI